MTYSWEVIDGNSAWGLKIDEAWCMMKKSCDTPWLSQLHATCHCPFQLHNAVPLRASPSCSKHAKSHTDWMKFTFILQQFNLDSFSTHHSRMTHASFSCFQSSDSSLPARICQKNVLGLGRGLGACLYEISRCPMFHMQCCVTYETTGITTNDTSAPVLSYWCCHRSKYCTVLQWKDLISKA